MAKTESKTTSKTTKKSKRRLKRSVRKTLGTLFLVSAIVVAAIPVDGLQAWTGDDATDSVPTKVWVADESTSVSGGNSTTNVIPTVTAGAPIYEDEKGAFQFAFYGADAAPSGLILLNYINANNTAAITGGKLTIPDTFDVYYPYSPGFRCAWGTKGFVYYRVNEQYKRSIPGPTPNTRVDEYGYVVIEKEGGALAQKPAEDTRTETGEMVGSDTGKKQWVYYSTEPNKTTWTYSHNVVSGSDVTAIENIEYKLEPYRINVYKPCYPEDKVTWEAIEEKGWKVDSDGTIRSEGLYYLVKGTLNGTDAEYGRVTEGVQRFKDIKLMYIGNQTIEKVVPADATKPTTWKATANYITSQSQGIFSAQKLGDVGTSASITSVTFGGNLLGIGDYAFYNASISKVEFNGGMYVIGDYAFTNCANLREVEFKNYGLQIIGAHAFENCVNLSEFQAPYTLAAIGDSAFAGCTALAKIELGDALSQLGYFAFENCSSLTSLTFPKTLREKVPISTIKGCVNLKYVKSDTPVSESINHPFSFVDKDGDAVHVANAYKDNYSLEQFRNELRNVNFYFEGPEDDKNGEATTALHQMARENLFAFKFLDQNIYEITTRSKNADGTGPYNATYQAQYNGGTSADTLLYVSIESGMENVTIPGVIGPCKITSIGANSFQNNCNLKSVTIPSTIIEIASNAFRGCHNLKTVTFQYDEEDNNPGSQLKIGANAFATQDVSTNTFDGHGSAKDTKLAQKPQLFFEGPISPNCEAFKYAMNPANNINRGTQDGPTYITYFSGWPSNLVVRYNDSTKRQELIAYPTIYNVYHDDTGLTDGDGKAIPWTSLNYIKWGNGYEEVFGSTSGSSITSAFLSYKNNNAVSANQLALINAILNITLPDGIQSVAWFDNPKASVARVSGGDVSGGDGEHISSTVIGVEDAEKVSLFTLNAAKEYKTAVNGTMLHGSKTVTTNGMEIPDRTFDNCDTLGTAYIRGNTTSMGNYAFMGCSNLTTVEIPTAMSSMGKRPFTGCDLLSNISCPSSEYFTCKNAILFGATVNGDGSTNRGNITRVVECLEGRRPNGISAEDLAGSTQLAEEAFAGTGVTSVVLTDTTIKEVPASAFQYTNELLTVLLPYDLAIIGSNAFSDSKIQSLEFTGDNLAFVESNAFSDTVSETVDGKYTGMTNKNDLYFVCQEGSKAETIAKTMGINTQRKEAVNYCTVEFYADDQTTLLYSLGNQRSGISVNVDKLIEDGLIKLPEKPGYKITWFPQNYDPIPTSSTGTIKTYAQYVLDEGEKYTITFLDDDYTTVISTQTISPSDKVVPPYVPAKNGKPLSGWVCVGGKYNINDLAVSAVNLKENVTFVAMYSSSESGGFLVRFLDWDGSVLYSILAQAGDTVTYEGKPYRAGYVFKGWTYLGAESTSNITGPVDAIAQYDTDTSGSGGSSGNGTVSGNGSGGNGNGTSNANATYYTLTVRNGSGSGSYIAGEQAIIVANDPAAGMEFSNWTIEPTDTKIASTGISATVITMPEKNVTVVANYKTKSSTNSGSGTTGSSNSSNTPGTTGTLNKGGTTVIINKNGLSNTGVVSATVNGSSDNFTIKISESGTASEAVVKALMAEYNNDLSNIKYFPMDISLYDSTGQKKITDTTGLKITITLPLPDSLSVYAGNNKVAGVVNDRLDKLTPKFTTISGVPCVTFTVEHFSPYVIYVDTTNLNANGMADSTPKTGDGIHPKWFLSLGLGCLSIVFFMQKDKKKEKKPVKVKA